MSKQEKRQPIPQTYKKVLLQIAKEGPQTKYDVEKKTKVNHASIHEAVKHFLKAGALEGKKVGVTRTGQAKIKYGLTLLGLCLTVQTADSRDYDEVILKWKHFLPLVFGKWNHFKSAGLGEERIKAINWLIGQILYWGVAGLEKLAQIDQLQFETEKWVMEQFFVYVFTLQTPPVKTLWMKAFRSDEQLRQWAINSLKQWLSEADGWMKINKRSLQVLEMSDEPDWDMVIKELRWHPPRRFK